MAAASSAIGEFRRELDVCRGLHNEFPPKSATFKDHIARIEEEIVAVQPNYPIDTIEITLEKKKKSEELAQKLNGISPEIQGVLESIRGNNRNLEQLKLQIQIKIAAAQLVADAKAQDEARTAEAAQEALKHAQGSVDAAIEKLIKFKDELRKKLEATITRTNSEGNDLIDIIKEKNAEIKSKLDSEPNISDETKSIVAGMPKTTPNTGLDRFIDEMNTQGTGQLDKFDEIIEKLQQVKNGNDINNMKTAVAGIDKEMEQPATELDKIIGEPANFITKLQGERDALFTQAENVTAALERDRVIAEMIKEANTLNNPEAQKFKDKLTKAEATNDTDTKRGNNTLLGSLLGNANSSLSLFEQTVLAFTDKFKKLKEEWSTSGIAMSTKQSELEKKIDDLKRLGQDERDKYRLLHAKYKDNEMKLSASPERPSSANSMSSISSVSPTGSVSPTVSPRPDLKPRPPPSATKKHPFTGRPSAAAARNALSPTEAWLSSALPSLSPPPGVHTESPDRQSSKLLGPKERYLFMPRNKKGKTGSPEDILSQAILVEIPADSSSLSLKSLDGSIRGGKRKHLQRGGAPPPSALPPESEIRIIYDYTPGIFDLITGLTPPNILLGDTDTSEENTDHPTIAKIRSGIPIVDQTEKQQIYNAIKQFLITKESKNPLDIGRKAVYKVNILKLLRLLDNQLGTGKQFQRMYQKLWTFMEYDRGTFDTLKSLFDATFATDRRKTRSDSAIPDIEAVFKDDRDIKKIVGWESQYKNVRFDKLFDVFSMKCKSTGNKSTFLSNDDPSSQKNLGSNRKFYYRFRLNWIILLAFHSLYIKKSKLEDIQLLISDMHDAFLGWMSRDKDTFERMFFKDNPNVPKSSDIYSVKVDNLINENIETRPSLAITVKTIKEKICDLDENKNPVMEIDSVDVDDDDDDDLDYVLSDDSDSGSESGSESGSGITSARGSLSSAGLSVSGRRSPTPPPSVPQLNLPGQQRRRLRVRPNSSVTIVPANTDRPPSGVSASDPKKPLRDAFGGVASAGGVSDSDPEDSFPDAYGGVASTGGVKSARTDPPFQHRARSITQAKPNQELWATPVLPRPPGQTGEFIRKERPSSAKERPSSASSSGNTSTNAQGSVQGSASGSSTDRGRGSNKVYPLPISGAVDPGHRKENAAISGTSRLPSTFRRTLKPGLSSAKGSAIGGSHKKRTCKHKKHISRHPTRRRRIAKPTPSEGDKYTRKRSRT
jgi:hypothetical protein